MIKTIKVKKQFRLDELLKYVWDNELNRIEAVSSSGRFKLKFIDNKSILVNSESTLGPFGSTVSLSTTEWEIEVEEEITRSTIFDCLVRVGKDGVVERTHCSISGIKNENTIRIYALLDEELQLIWEAK